MIYFISDIHGDINFKGLQEYLDIATDKDLLIILGDLELNFCDTQENREFTEQFLRLNKNIAFIDGNHENFAYLDAFPIEEWQGGEVNRLTQNIVRLRRGSVYQIDGLKFFTFGGCKSSAKWKEMGLWHFGDEPTESECALAVNNLNKNANKVDYILTHKYELEDGVGNGNKLLFDLCKYIDENVSFNKWLAGHWHKIAEHDKKHLYIYNQLLSLDSLEY